MTVTDVRQDPATHTLTLEAEFDAAPTRAWQLFADPRQLERWWGPPTYPATVTHHDLTPGGRVDYHMTGPAGDEAHGYWEVDEVDPPQRLAFRDGFSNADGSPNPGLPVSRVVVRLESLATTRTRVTIESAFPSSEAMEQLLGMGMAEGLREAVGQIDALLAAPAA